MPAKVTRASFGAVPGMHLPPPPARPGGAVPRQPGGPIPRQPGHPIPRQPGGPSMVYLPPPRPSRVLPPRPTVVHNTVYLPPPAPVDDGTLFLPYAPTAIVDDGSTSSAPAAPPPPAAPAPTPAPVEAVGKRETVGAVAGATVGFLVGGPVGAAAGAIVGGVGAWLTRPSAAPSMSGEETLTETPTTKYVTARTSDLLLRPTPFYRFVPKPVIDHFAPWAARVAVGSKRFGRWEAHVNRGIVTIYGPPFGAAMGSEFDSLNRHGLRSRPYR